MASRSTVSNLLLGVLVVLLRLRLYVLALILLSRLPLATTSTPKSLTTAFNLVSVHDALNDVAVGHELRFLCDLSNGRCKWDDGAKMALRKVRVCDLIKTFRLEGWKTMDPELVGELRTLLREDKYDIPMKAKLVFMEIEYNILNAIPNKIDHITKFYAINDVFGTAAATVNDDDDDDLDGAPAFDPCLPKLAFLDGSPLELANRCEAKVFEELEDYANLDAGTCASVKTFAEKSLEYLMTIPADADTVLTTISSLLAFLLGPDGENHAETSDLSKL